VRWRGWLKAPQAGKYALRLEADDGVRLWLDGKLVLEAWKTGPNRLDAEVSLTGGPQRFQLEYFQGVGGADCKLLWARGERGAEGLATIPPEAYFRTKAAAEKKGTP
jgi:hypothetical protein